MNLKQNFSGQLCCALVNPCAKVFLQLVMTIPFITFYPLKSQNTTSQTKELIRLKLDSKNNSDQTVVYLTENATSAFDSKYDAYKLTNPILNLYTISSDQQNLSINGVSNKITEEHIPLCFKSKEPGIHHFEVTAYTNPGLFAEAYIHDTYQNTIVPILLGTEFEVLISTEDSCKLISDRFIIILKGSTISSVITSYQDHISEEHIDIYPNPISGTSQLNLHVQNLKSDFINIKIKTLEGKEIGTHYSSLSQHIIIEDIGHLVAGVYWVEIKHTDGSRFHKKFIKE